MKPTHQIVRIGKSDAYYNGRKRLVGKKLHLVRVDVPARGGYVGCIAYIGNKRHSFYRIMLRKLK